MEHEKFLNKKVSRRDALRLGRDITLGGAATVFFGIDSGITSTHQAQQNIDTIRKPDPPSTTQEQEEHHEDESHNSKVNDFSAVGVTIVFTGAIGSVATGKTEFGLKTIAPVMGAEAIRMSLLKAYEPEVFNHEAKELAVSLGLVPVLAAVAETADTTRVYVDSLFESTRIPDDDAETLALAETHALKHKIENLSERSLPECQEYLEEHREEIVRIAAANAALVTIASPLATTYVGASAAADSFAPMTSALTKAYYAEQVVKAKEQNEALDHKKFKEQALEKAVDAMNGQKGYCNLSLAMAANTSGMAGIGDPPLIYSLLLNRSLYNHALVSAEGGLFSELASTSANNVWLKSLDLGVSSKDYSAKFIRYHARTAKAIGSALFDGEKRQGFLWGYAGQSKDVTRILEFLGKAGDITDENVNQLREHLQSICQPVFEQDFSEFFPQKGRGLINDIKEKLALVNLAQKPIQEQPLTEVDFEQALADLRQEPSIRQKTEKARELDERKKAFNVEELGALLLNILQDGDTQAQKEKLKELASQIDSRGPDKLSIRFMKMLAEDSSISENEIDTIAPLFGVMGAKEVEKSLKHALEHYRGSMREHPKDELLGHSASEVVAALATQLPAVPSLVHLTEKALPHIVGNSASEALPMSIINKKVAAVLVATAAISSTADNVAAYLFGKAVLEEQFKEEYGEELSYEYKWFANDAALLAAIVGGSLSKVGNGANFLISKVDAHMEGDTIDVKKKKIDLANSYANPYSLTQTGVILAGLMAQKVAIDKGLPNPYSIER